MDAETLSKKELRALIRRRKSAFSTESLRELSQAIMERVFSHPQVAKAHTLMMYASLPDEVYTLDVLETLRQAGKRVYLPEVVSDTEMRLRVYEGLSSLSEGAFHIMEPTGDICLKDTPIDVAIIPGMAFDRQGHRLGRGKGYYDRFLRGLHLYKIGVCFGFQLLDAIPYDEHDVVMDEVVSEG